MSTKIRLARQGCKKNPFYTIVVQDSRVKTRGAFKAILGHYDPMRKIAKIDLESLASWISKGAAASERVKSIVKVYENANTEA